MMHGFNSFLYDNLSVLSLPSVCSEIKKQVQCSMQEHIHIFASPHSLKRSFRISIYAKMNGETSA